MIIVHMKPKSAVCICSLSVFLLSVTSCGSFLNYLLDLSDASEMNSNVLGSKDLPNTSSVANDGLSTVRMGSNDWYSFSDVYRTDLTRYMSITLGERNGITLELIGSLDAYEVTKVSVFARSKKPSAEGSYYEKEWPHYDNGKCKRQLYISTGFQGRYGFSAYIDRIYGSLKPWDMFLKDEDGCLLKSIEDDYGTITYSFSGMERPLEEPMFRLPEKVGEVVPTKIGYKTFHLFGMENVKTLIIPKNYTGISFEYYWKNINFDDIFYEGNEDTLETVSGLYKQSIKMYREEDPNPDASSDEYTYWHYVDGKPQIW